MKIDIIQYKGENTFGFDRSFSIEIIELNNVQKDKLNIVQGNDVAYNRKVLEHKHVDIILHPLESPRKDSFHFRSSGFDQVLCKLAKKNNIALGFSFYSILKSKNRRLLLGRMRQNVRFCRKYEITMVFGSFAKNKWELRSYSDLVSFAKILGMTAKEAQDSFTAIDNILKSKKYIYVKKGVRIIPG